MATTVEKGSLPNRAEFQARSFQQRPGLFIGVGGGEKKWAFLSDTVKLWRSHEKEPKP